MVASATTAVAIRYTCDRTQLVFDVQFTKNIRDQD